MGAYAQKDDWEVFMKSLRFLVLAAALVLSYAVVSDISRALKIMAKELNEKN